MHDESSRKKNDSQRRRCNPEGLSYGRSPFLGCLTLVCGSRFWATVHFGLLALEMGGGQMVVALELGGFGWEEMSGE